MSNNFDLRPLIYDEHRMRQVAPSQTPDDESADHAIAATIANSLKHGLKTYEDEMAKIRHTKEQREEQDRHANNCRSKANVERPELRVACFVRLGPHFPGLTLADVSIRYFPEEKPVLVQFKKGTWSGEKSETTPAKASLIVKPDAYGGVVTGHEALAAEIDVLADLLVNAVLHDKQERGG